MKCCCTNCDWKGDRDDLIRSPNEWDFPPRCCPQCHQETILDASELVDDTQIVGGFNA